MFILGASSQPDEWDAVFARVPIYQQDVHFTSAYGRVQEAANQGRAILAVQEFGDGEFIAQPFLMQRIPDTELFDLKNLYGFGGPVSNLTDLYSLNSLGDMFRLELGDWARGAGVVSEYCVLHPLLPFYQSPLLVRDNVLYTKQVVVIEQLSNFTEERCSRRVKRALNRSARFEVVEVADPFTFDVLYVASMMRLEAAKRWWFGIDYWLAHKHEDVGAKWYWVPGHRGLLVIGKGRTAYAHFLGSSGEKRRDGLDEALYFHAAQDLAKQGFERFHLGGGLTEHEDDPLLRFKSGFSESRWSIGTYRRVFMPDVYAQLPVKDPSWFPAYRSAA